MTFNPTPVRFGHPWATEPGLGRTPSSAQQVVKVFPGRIVQQVPVHPGRVVEEIEADLGVHEAGRQQVQCLRLIEERLSVEDPLAFSGLARRRAKYWTARLPLRGSGAP